MSDELTIREVFRELTEANKASVESQKKAAETFKQQNEVLKDLTVELAKMRGAINENSRLLTQKYWWFMWACLMLAAAALGISPFIP